MARLYVMKRNIVDELVQTPDDEPTTPIMSPGALSNEEDSSKSTDKKENEADYIKEERCDNSLLQSIISEFRHHPDFLLSNQNLQLILKGLGEPTDSNTVQEWINFYDQNNKGGIDLVGFLRMVMDQILPIEDSEEEVEDSFKVFDTENSGQISCNALEYVLKTRGNPLTTEEFSILMNKNNPKKEKLFNWKEFCHKFTKEIYEASNDP
ncbi:neo-calmodulin isoform X2 [Hydra vulgaris]|uniref:Neo-calmodulin isoform X2 n=1 Tax=Hydra vulgaris TaxID=6087 RepID=A0ABM4CT92_HYDVU